MHSCYPDTVVGGIASYSALHSLGPDPSTADRARYVRRSLVHSLQQRPGTRHCRPRRSKTPPAAGDLLPPQLKRLLVHGHVLGRHVPLPPPSASIRRPATLFSPAQSPVRAMGLPQPAAAVLPTTNIAFLNPASRRNVGEPVGLIHLYAASRGAPQKTPADSGVRSSANVCIERAIAPKRKRSCSAVRTAVKRTGLPVRRRLNVMLRS